MPGLYIHSRSSSSSANALHAPLTSTRHLHVGPAAPIRPPAPPFLSSERGVLATGAAHAVQSVYPSEIIAPEHSKLRGGTRTLNYSSSGSLHGHDPSSVCLAAMVNEFLEEEEEEGSDQKASLNWVEKLCKILKGYTGCTHPVILMEVEKAMMELTAGEEGAVIKVINGGSRLKRAVMTRLREAGYNAAVCKSRWNHVNGLGAGNYKYIDVIVELSAGKDRGKLEERVIIDIDFRAQFEIARPSGVYAQMLGAVPKVYVGKAERVKQVVKIMSQAMKRSLEAQRLMMPPWRRYRYMQSKWLSPIHRMEAAREGTHKHREEEFGAAKYSASIKASRGTATRELNPRERVRKREEGNHRRVPRGFEAVDLHRQRPRTSFCQGKYREITCTAMCTSWQLPSLAEKPIKAATMVSALSSAMREGKNAMSAQYPGGFPSYGPIQH